MKLEFKPKYVGEILGIISQLVTEVNIKLNLDGISIIALDPASVAMVIFEMPKSSFVNYDVKQEESIAVNLEDLKSVLKRMEKSETIVLERKDNSLSLSSKAGIKKHFSLALINLEGEERARPNLNPTSSIEMSSDLFSDAIQDSIIISDSCSFITTKDTFSIIAAGTLNKSEIEFSSDEAKLMGGGDKAKYSLDYLEKFVKSSKIFDKVRISFKSDHPLELGFFSDEAKLSFILAPRVEEE